MKNKKVGIKKSIEDFFKLMGNCIILQCDNLYKNISEKVFKCYCPGCQFHPMNRTPLTEGESMGERQLKNKISALIEGLPRDHWKYDKDVMNSFLNKLVDLI